MMNYSDPRIRILRRFAIIAVSSALSYLLVSIDQLQENWWKVVVAAIITGLIAALDKAKREYLTTK